MWPSTRSNGRARRFAWPSFAFALAPCLLGTSVRAAPEEKRFELVYSAPGDCPDRAALVASLNRYTPDTVFAENTGQSERILVIVSKTAGTFQAAIVDERAGESPTTRLVPAATCAETVDATALVIAILVDPEAGRRAAAGAAVPTTPGADGGADAAPASSPEPPAVATPATPPAPPVSTTRPPSIDQDRSDRRDSRASSPTSWAFGGSALVGVTSMMTNAAALDVLVGPHAESTARALVSPFLGAYLHYAPSSSFHDGGSSASFHLLSGRAVGCPIRVRFDGDHAWLGPCASFEVGRLEGSGNVGGVGKSSGILWVAPGLSVRGAFGLGPLFAAVDLGTSFPFERDWFYFDPRKNSLYRVPPAAFAANLGVGVSIP